MVEKLKKDGTVETRVTDDNVIQPFQLDVPNLRGRMIKLGRVLDEIIGKHSYPVPVSQLLGETALLTLLLSAMLKYEGIFSLQIRSDGPVSFILCDVTSAGDVRGYAGFDKKALNALMKKDRAPKLGDIMGEGNITFTVDQGNHMDRYQGIVELYGDSLVESVHHYFNMSEQIKTGIKLAVKRQEDGKWRAGAIMLQCLPEEKTNQNTEEDDWRRTMILLDTCTDSELLSTELHSADVLYRLYHEEQVRIFDPVEVQHKCRCSRKKVQTILKTLSKEDIEESKKNDAIKITCEFCGKEYNFNDAALQKIIQTND